jgi:signal transduction histidine kinase
MSRMSLESAVARVFQHQQRFTFARIGTDLTVVERAGNFAAVLPGSPDTAENQPLSQLIPAFAGHEGQLQAVLDGEKAEFELKYVKKELADGSTLYHNMRAVPLPAEDGAAGLLLIIEEVTNTAKMGQQLVYYNKTLTQAQEKVTTAESELAQLNQFKKYLLSMLSHDMRTPLAAIRGYAELLHRMMKTNQVAANPDKAFGFADNICYITDQMTWLINDIIDLNLSEQGTLELSLENCDMQEVIEETLEMYDSIIKMQQLSLSLELNPPNLLVSADPQRLRQVANNLIGNAIKRTPQGGEFAIRTAVEGGTAVLTVTDTGPAMSDEEIEKIFQPYYRSKEAKVSNILGSGLGLNIVKVLVEAQTRPD